MLCLPLIFRCMEEEGHIGRWHDPTFGSKAADLRVAVSVLNAS